MATTFRICRVAVLPADIPVLADLAANEGHLHVNRLVDDFDSGANTFGERGEALFVAIDVQQNSLAVGGLNVDPYANDRRIARVRRLYVHPQHRRSGIAAAMMRRIEDHARAHFAHLQLFTSSPAASRFYASLGYSRVATREKVSHAKRLDR